MLHFSVHSDILYYNTKFLFSSCQGSHSRKRQFIVKTWSFTKSKLLYNLQLKTDSVKDFIIDIARKFLNIFWEKTQLPFTFLRKFLVEACTDSGRDSLIYSKTFMFIEMASSFTKTDSLTGSVTTIYSKGLRLYWKTDFVATLN